MLKFIANATYSGQIHPTTGGLSLVEKNAGTIFWENACDVVTSFSE